MAERKQVQQYVLEPTTGKAIPVLRGQVLRIKQLGKGQCLDFNAFNLHDYKEFFHCGRTRHMHGLNPTKGDHLWSAPPRDRIMFTILEDTVCTNDVNYPRCSAFLFEYQFGFDGHPAHSNCHAEPAVLGGCPCALHPGEVRVRNKGPQNAFPREVIRRKQCARYFSALQQSDCLRPFLRCPPRLIVCAARFVTMVSAKPSACRADLASTCTRATVFTGMKCAGLLETLKLTGRQASRLPKWPRSVSLRLAWVSFF